MVKAFILGTNTVAWHLAHCGGIERAFTKRGIYNDIRKGKMGEVDACVV